MLTDIEWLKLLIKCGVRPLTASNWAPVFARVVTQSTFSAGRDEIDDFLGQVLHECAMLERLEENLNYSAKRMTEVWPKRFPTIESAAPFANNGPALANKVYGGRMGNHEPGDGWRFRGRGLLMATGRDNYSHIGLVLGLDLENNPDMLAQPETALRSAIAWWEGNIPDGVLGDIKKITKRVNGGTVGIAHRQDVTEKVQKGLA